MNVWVMQCGATYHTLLYNLYRVDMFGGGGIIKFACILVIVIEGTMRLLYKYYENTYFGNGSFHKVIPISNFGFRCR